MRTSRDNNLGKLETTVEQEISSAKIDSIYWIDWYKTRPEETHSTYPNPFKSRTTNTEVTGLL